MEGSPQAEVHDVFSNRLLDLQDKSSAIAEAFTGAGARPWMIPPGLEGRDLLNVPALHNPDWDRDPINVNYDEAMASTDEPGTVGDIISLKMQTDYNAAEERAFRLRHATYIRCMTHAHGRRSAHGQAGIFPAALRQASGLIRAGGMSKAEAGP